MIVRSVSTFARRFFTALALGSIAVPAAALAGASDPLVKEAVAEVAAAEPLVSVVGKSIATGVDKRNPVGDGVAFDPSVGAVYAWVKVKNLGDATTITMVWKKEGKKKLAVELAVGHAYGWKTWSKKGISSKDFGAWTVEVLDANGTLVDTLAFEVAAGAPEVGGF